MKNIFLKLFAFVIILSSIGCSKDYLETAPTDSVSAKDALSTPANMMVVLNGMHRNMYAQSGLNGYSYAGDSYMKPWYAFGGDDIIHSTTGNGWFLGVIQWNRHTDPSGGDLGWAWYYHYNHIMTANNIINAAEGMVVDDLLANVLGQAYAYRAWGHFNLVRLWGKNYLHGNPSTDLGVPYMVQSKAPFEGQPRETVEAVYTKLKEDINTSISYFEEANSRPDKSHLNIDVAHGLAARIYLTSGDYDLAAQHANAARQDYDLMDESEYKSGFNSTSSSEWMWGGKVVQDQTNYYRAWFYYIGTNFNGSQNRGNPKFINHKLYAQISDTDFRKDMWDPMAPNTIAGWENDPNYATEDEFWNAWSEVRSANGMSSRFNTYPYMSLKFKNSAPSSIEPDDVLYMRAAEMYLIEAEALASSGKSAEAAQVLFDLVSTRDDAYVLSTNTGAALVDEIMIHRRIELWGEGFRWFDMLRHDEALDRTGTGADIKIYTAKGFTQDKPSTNDLWLWKIPLDEINANKAISPEDQN